MAWEEISDKLVRHIWVHDDEECDCSLAKEEYDKFLEVEAELAATEKE